MGNGKPETARGKWYTGHRKLVAELLATTDDRRQMVEGGVEALDRVCD